MIWLQAAVLTLAALGDGEPVLLDFTAVSCLPCRQMAPTIDRLAAAGCRVQKIDFDRNRALADRYGVTKIPCFVMLSGDREIGRVVGITSYGRLLKLYRQADEAHKSTARNMRSSDERPPLMPMRPGSGLAAGRAPSPSATSPSVPSAVTHAGWESRPNTTPLAPRGIAPANTTPANSDGVSDAHLIAASVRIRVADPNGQSCGTGTIIDARRGWALVLTCGHIFRDYQGRGRIEVDLFGPDGPARAEAELVSYDIQRDIGLLRFKSPTPVTVARVSPPTRRITKGDPVISVGCNNGDSPTARHSRISSKNKYLGPPNLQTGGMPVEGRSGGGLFSADGLVIGVCNCADPEDNEGLYAAGEVIRAELDRANLSFVYRDQPGGSNSGPGDQLIASVAGVPSAIPPAMPKRMPPPGKPLRPISRLQQTAVHEPLSVQTEPLPAQAAPTQAVPAALSRAETATLEELMRQLATGAEIVCVVNPRGSPAAKSQSIALQRSSPAFLNRIASELGTAAAEVVSIIRLPANPGGKSEIIILDQASAAFLRRLGAEIGAAGGIAVTAR